jgi:8-oxo-dGTP pyrophosphatase MutT (NUDIX family)
MKARALPPSAKFIALSHLRRLRGCEQVAAVCYRTRGAAIEFLLVQTRGGRWTFPKGNAEPGLTHAQAAALEAFEEAGVHGRMEEASFARYTRRKRGRRDAAAAAELAVNAHLCEVLWLGPPQESDRNPTWFSPEKAKRRLREDRIAGDATELARVVDRAVARIHRLRRTLAAGDALQKVQFTIQNPPRGQTRSFRALKRKSYGFKNRNSHFSL